jgi:hypothetical protein
MGNQEMGLGTAEPNGEWPGIDSDRSRAFSQEVSCSIKCSLQSLHGLIGTCPVCP